jgi:signal transduction histidine kinase
VTVADTGPGVLPDIEERIFELDVTSRGPGAGLGLGLPICRSIVQQTHGGRIGFEREAGRTVFYVELPYAPPEREEEAGKT